MANRNVTVVCRPSQFKDYVSARERLLICDIKNSPDVKNRFQKKSRSFCLPCFGSKAALV